MPDLVTIDEARAHLRLDADSNGGPDDAWLAIFMPAISEAVADWLKEAWRLYQPYFDSSGDVVIDSAGDPIPAEPLTVRSKVKAACLVELERQYRFRGGEGGETDVPSADGWGYALGKGAVALLASSRKPTAA